jgi:cytochrome c-type biogenesis protein CcmH/NrfF
MTDRVKVYEEKNDKGMPIWMWLLPLLLLVAILALWFTHNRAKSTATRTSTAPATRPAARTYPDLATVHVATAHNQCRAIWQG